VCPAQCLPASVLARVCHACDGARVSCSVHAAQSASWLVWWDQPSHLEAHLHLCRGPPRLHCCAQVTVSLPDAPCRYLIGAFSQSTGNFYSALWLLAGCLAVAAVNAGMCQRREGTAAAGTGSRSKLTTCQRHSLPSHTRHLLQLGMPACSGLNIETLVCVFLPCHVCSSCE
jgi:hypothetical protein